MTTDVEMKSVDSPAETETTEVKKDVVDLLSIEEVREHARQIEKAVHSKEPRFVLRVLRALPNTRRKLNGCVLRRIVTGFYTHSAQERDALLAFIEQSEKELESTPRLRSSRSSSSPLLPEVDAYIHLLVLIRLVDTGKKNEAVVCSGLLMQKVTSQNRRTLDLVAAKCYFYHSMAYELTEQLNQIRGFLHARLRTATLRNDFEGQAVLINCLLRNYLHYSLYDQADKLVSSKYIFPEVASNNEWARHLYYLGCIKATQLEYSAAHKHLTQALRKAPQHTAVGFKQTVHKLDVTVELLLGDIPERQVFRHSSMRRALAPYFQLTQAVRLGDLKRFGEVLRQYGTQFQQDHTYTLILRLRHNVIKTAIRAVGLSYSRISLQDVTRKLTLDSPDEAEFIIAKAIRDGVIEATLDHEKGYVRSRETSDVYCTREPQLAFHQRISFCLDIHNQSVKAMRYPPKAYNKDLESAEGEVQVQLTRQQILHLLSLDNLPHSLRAKLEQHTLEKFVAATETQEIREKQEFLRTELQLMIASRALDKIFSGDNPPDLERGLQLLDELYMMPVNCLMLKKQPTAVELVAKLTHYKGSTKLWNLTSKEQDIFQGDVRLLRDKSGQTLNRFVQLCKVPCNVPNFLTWFQEQAKLLRTIVSGQNFVLMTQEPILVELETSDDEDERMEP